MQVFVITTHGRRAPPSSMGFLGKAFCFLSRTQAFCNQGEFEKALASTMQSDRRGDNKEAKRRKDNAQTERPP